MPVSKAKENVDDYEITPEYQFKENKKTGKVQLVEKPWVIKDERNVPSYSLLPATMVLEFINQLVQILGL